MRQLPRSAQLYLLTCYGLGALATVWFFAAAPVSLTIGHWLLAGILLAAAALCQVFVVSRKTKNEEGTTGKRNDHLTLAPLFAALLLLPGPLLALVIIATFVPEWYIYRRKWFGQIFNMSVYLVAAAIARMTLLALTGESRFVDPGTLFSLTALGVLATIPVFEFVQVFMLAIILKIASGQSFRESGLFELRSILLEVGLICLGIGFATSYIIDPLYGLVASLPLVLIFDALHVPNLKEEASTDPKTGLANMRHFNAVMDRDIERAERSGQPLSLLVCDLDYLRNINNTYGHQAGDIVLVGIAKIIKRQIRSSDVAARFGGEEFVILLSDTTADEALVVAERLRQELEETVFDVGHVDGPIRATMSIGTATYPQDGRSHEALMHEADLAVYQAKRDGRNRVVVAGRDSRELAGEWAREHLVPAAPPEANRSKEVVRPFWDIINQVTRASINNDDAPAIKAQRVPTTKQPEEKLRPSKRRRRPDPSPQTLAFIAIVVAAGLTGLVLGPRAEGINWWSLGLVGVLVMISEQVAVRSTGNGKVSVSIVPIVAAALLYGVLGILVAALASATSLALRGRSPLHRAFFNFGMVLLSTEAALWIFEQTRVVPLTADNLGALIVPGVLAGLAYHVVNQVLLCVVRGIHERKSPIVIWLAEYKWLWPHYGVLGALGLVVALADRVFGAIGIVALMSPVVMMHLAIKQYMDNTAVFVDELQHANGRLTESYEATLKALTTALDTRDEETEEHSQRVKLYTELIGKQMQVPDLELEDILRGALLHDIGKIGVPDAILLKPGKLTADEIVMMRKHPEIGYRMIAHIPFLARGAQVVLHHHEAFDGSGYPSGLVGPNIPLGARIFAVADTFDAMTSDRPYRQALPVDVAIAEIKRCRGTQFDPAVVDAFLAIPTEALLEVAAVVRLEAHNDTLRALVSFKS